MSKRKKQDMKFGDITLITGEDIRGLNKFSTEFVRELQDNLYRKTNEIEFIYVDPSVIINNDMEIKFRYGCYKKVYKNIFELWPHDKSDFLILKMPEAMLSSIDLMNTIHHLTMECTNNDIKLLVITMNSLVLELVFALSMHLSESKNKEFAIYKTEEFKLVRLEYEQFMSSKVSKDCDVQAHLQGLISEFRTTGLTEKEEEK